MNSGGRPQAARLALLMGLVTLLMATSGTQAAGRPIDCTLEAFQALGLVDQEFGRPITFTSVELISGARGVPDQHCACHGTIWPQINFVVKIPEMYWNGRFFMLGGGGWNGVIYEPAMTPYLRAGYATAATDSGHREEEPLAAFAYNPPDNSNPHASQKRLDYAYRSYHETSLAARAMIEAFQGEKPKYSYWVGCSEGGREALLMAQRYPKDFQGIICGAPALNPTGAFTWFIWNALALSGEGRILSGRPGEIDQIPYLAWTVYDRCDGRDGLVDGLIDDPRNCDFDPARDLNVCDQPRATCFTPAQIQALKRIYGGVRDSGGRPLFPGMPPGAEWEWHPWLLGSPSTQLEYGESFMLYYACTPPLADLKNAQGQPWTWRDFDFDRDPKLLGEASKLLDTTDTDLTAFKDAGGKLLHYTGWSDPALTAFMSLDYYQGVRKTMGAKAADDFYRFYLIPGAAHCGGGMGCFDQDRDIPRVLFPALVKWVENDVPPGPLKGTRPRDGRSRPMCPYPQVARFLGAHGRAGIEDAGNFTCVEPAAALVAIPGPVSLSQGSSFTARLTLPAGYHGKGLKPVALVCAGAPGGQVQRIASRKNSSGVTQPMAPVEAVYQAVFKTADLINIKPGDAVVFTLTGIFDQNGKRVAFEGSQTVQVLP